MKKISVILVLILAVQCSFAKKVKFSVNMTGQVLDPFGIHVMGDFQQIAGLGGDWTPDAAQMIKDLADTNIYYLYVDIPAFAKYEYLFINGEESYQVEVVPPKARVGYGNVDNRWIYIDSLANDTTILPTFVFSQTSPAGLTMMRFIVDMTLQAVSPNGVHVAGNFQGWDPGIHRLYSFGSSTYEIILYDTAGNVNDYNFYNGNAVSDVEFVSGPCVINSIRSLSLSADTILPKICYASCNTCYPLSVSDNAAENNASLYPNPMNAFTVLKFNDSSPKHQVMLSDLSGRIVREYTDVKDAELKIGSQGLHNGMYVVTISNSEGQRTAHKLTVEN